MRYIKSILQSYIGELEFKIVNQYIVFDTYNFSNYQISIKHLIHAIKLNTKSNFDSIFLEDLFQDITFLDGHGFKINDYNEIVISLTPFNIEFIPDSYMLDVPFLIDNVYVSFGPPTDLFNCVMSLKYGNFQNDGFDEKYFTLKIITKSKINDLLEIVEKALFFLNTEVFKSYKVIFFLEKMQIPGAIFLDYDFNIDDDLDYNHINKAYNKMELLFGKIEPYKIYNYSLLNTYYNKYIYLYKILEFYASLQFETLVDHYRIREDFDSNRLIEFIKKNNEETSLKNLISQIIDPDDLKRLNYIIVQSNLDKNFQSSSISHIIYSYRNSIVHSKYNKKKEIILPDLYPNNKLLNNMIELIEEVTLLVINNYDLQKLIT